MKSSARPEMFRRAADSDAILRELGINGVFNAEGEDWRSQRRLTVAALAQRNLRQLYPSVRTVAARLKKRWEGSAGQTLDIVDELKRFTVDVTMLIAFGHDVNTVEQSEDVIQRDLSSFFRRSIGASLRLSRPGDISRRPATGGWIALSAGSTNGLPS